MTLRSRIPCLAAGLAALVLLASCGGATESSSGISMPSPLSAVSRPTPLAQQATSTSTVATITATQLLDWAEGVWSGSFFPPAGKIARTNLGAYAEVRYYPASQYYVGVTSGTDAAVFVLGPITGGNVIRVGTLASYNCSVAPSSCTTTTVNSSANTSGAQCTYSYSAFNSSASVQKTSTVAWSCNSTQRSVTGNGIPDHATGTFPSLSNPSTIAAVTVNAAMPLIPAIAASVTSNVHVIGYALNGIKMDPATAATCAVNGSTVTCTADGNTGSWNIEALGQSTMNLGLDSNNAHVQPDGSYHYHGMPEGFLTRLGGGTTMRLVGFALDGFPIYARYGYSSATSATSALKVITSSYQLKTTPSAGRPSTASYPMGMFTQDYQYTAGAGDLDECNGRTGVTPEFPNGIYHYFITDSYPFMGRCLKGTPTLGR